MVCRGVTRGGGGVDVARHALAAVVPVDLELVPAADGSATKNAARTVYVQETPVKGKVGRTTNANESDRVGLEDFAQGTSPVGEVSVGVGSGTEVLTVVEV